MQRRVYDALIFRQRDEAPLQVAFTASSCEIDAWARVPTKRTANVRNFQRAQIPTHIKEVAQFFKHPANASPTAVVVGFDPIRAMGRVRTLDDQDREIGDGPGASALRGGEWRKGRIEITWDEDTDPRATSELVDSIVKATPNVRAVIFAELSEIASLTEPRLSELADVFSQRLLGAVSPELEEEDSNGDSEAVEQSDELEPPIEMDLSPEVRELLPGLSPSEQQVVAGRLGFLAQLDPEYLKTRQVEWLKTVEAEVRDELKPGLLIDGQHRIAGTKKLGDIPFLVTALPLAEWPELAFQFIVTNRTAKRVPESLLISIVGNSLSKEQREKMEERLRQAGIRVGLIEAVMRVHEDEQSPFYRMVSFGIAHEVGFLDAAAMRGKVIGPWYERKAPMRQLTEHLCKGRTGAERTEFWKSEELWFAYFIAFWSAVRERYDGSAVFSSELTDRALKTPASKMMTATVLMIFQDTILTHLQKYLENKANTEKIPIASSLPSEEKFTELVKNMLSKLTPDFFTEWMLSGFDGSRGAREDLADAVRKVISGEKTVAQLKKKEPIHRLFKAST